MKWNIKGEIRADTGLRFENRHKIEKIRSIVFAVADRKFFLKICTSNPLYAMSLEQDINNSADLDQNTSLEMVCEKNQSKITCKTSDCGIADLKIIENILKCTLGDQDEQDDCIFEAINDGFQREQTLRQIQELAKPSSQVNITPGFKML